ncbi:hypothetical protein OEZ85_000822 [Tetradesmus obliquus]|uniref:Sushi domain-containing protein n=1 Tax=Tetradesmus obliquus TaxID=3088 RepID=A0ABY8UKS2_TETOB|nr:hypothetical protein OEZ85_000822 [Tetradesmus obliquus]
MVSPGREGRIWAALLLVILLVTPSSPPGQTGRQSSTRFGDSNAKHTAARAWGVVTVDANLLGSLIEDQLSDLKWGATGGFAGFSGLSLERKDCSDLYEPDNPIYASETEAEGVIQTSEDGKTAYNVFQASEKIQGGIDLFTEILGYVSNTAIAMYWVPYGVARLGCGSAKYGQLGDEEDDLSSPPEPAATPPTSSGVAYKMWTKTKSLYEAAKKNPAVKLFLPTARYVVNSFITPIKQSGVIIKLVGKVAAVSAAEKGGKVLEALMDEPEEKLKTAIGTTTKWCKRTNTYLEFMQGTVIAKLDELGDIMSILETFAFIPWSYGGCALQEKWIISGRAEYRAGQSPGGRKLQQTVQGSFLADSEQMLLAANAFYNTIKSISENLNNTVTPPLTTAFNTWESVESAVDSAGGIVKEAVNFFDFMPEWLPPIIFGLAESLSFMRDCPDYICGLTSWVGIIIDWAIDGMIQAIGDPNITSLEDLFMEALTKLGVPIPAWWSNGIGIDLPFDNEIGLFGFQDDIKDAVNNTQAAVRQAITDLISGVITKLTPSQLIGTRVLDVAIGSTSEIRRRVSVTSEKNIVIQCPNTATFTTAGIYMERFTLQTPPDCNADYTAWLRFPCANGTTSCTIDWTQYDWKCLQYQNGLPIVAALGAPQRYVTATYDCVTTAGLASFKLLPELLSASKTGQSSLPPLTYSPTNLPAVNVIQQFAQGIGNLGSISSSLIPSPKPGVRSNAAASTSVPRAAPPFDAYSQGSFNYSLLNPFYEISGSTVTTTCSGAAPFGLPSLLIEGTDVDACYDNAYWNTFLATYPSNRGSVYDSTYDVRYFRILVRSQVQALLSDMCGWRMVAKRGYIGALTNATKTTLRSMVPPMLLPWSGPPTEQQFRDFWGPRGACEYFSDGSGRSHLSHSNWNVTRASTELACRQQVIGPTCYPGKFPANPSSDSSTWSRNVVCDTSSRSLNWPLVNPATDPVLKTAAVPASVCGNNLPDTQRPTACFSDRPSWCGPRARSTSTPDVLSSLSAQDYFSQMDYYFADLSTTTVTNAQNSQANLATVAAQWAAECALDYVRGQEYAAREALLDAYAARPATLAATCAATLAACQYTKSSCPIADLFRCAKNLGVIQFACVPDPSTTSGSSTTLVFKVSLVTAAKQIGCGANQVLQIVSAEVGTGRTIKDAIKAVVENMCNANGTSCTLDPNSPALGTTGPNDVLKVVWKCACGPGAEDPAGNGNCTACDAGTYRSNSSSMCTLTPPGTYTNNTGSAAPTPCPPGTYAENYGQASCTLCPALTYSTAVGASNASVCVACTGANSYSQPGATECSTCPLGTVLVVSTTNSTNGTTVTSYCADCSPGTYRTATETLCTECDPGTYAAYGATNTTCTEAPAGYYAPLAGTITPTPCEQGTYQPFTGSTSCLPCPDGTDATIVGATSAAQCTGVTVVPESKMKQLQDLARTPSRDLTLKGLGRRLLASRSLKSFEPDEPCSLLGEELARLGLVANASTFLAEVGNSFCSPSPWLNSPACNYDGGDCCPSTCQPLCEQVSSANETIGTLATYVTLSWSCSRFQCSDPSVQANSTKASVNCTGTAVSSPNSLLQRLLLPVVAGDVVDVKEVLQRVGRAKLVSATGTSGVCDPSLNNEANNWDGGDCCADSCKPNSAIPGSCEFIPAAACLDPTYSNPEQPPADVQPPVITAPADYTTSCGSTIFSTTGLTAYDKVDGIIVLAAPTISSSNSLPVSLTEPLPCASTDEVYTVSLTWTAKDGADNTATAVQTIYVLPPPPVLGCSGSPTAPANATAFDCTGFSGPGDVCTTTCQPGYTLTSGTLVAVCSSDAVPVWSEVLGVCSPSNCTELGPAAPDNAANYTCPETPSGGKCSTSCLPGFGLTEETTLQTTCSLGNWSTPDGICFELGCSGTSPVLPANAQEFTCSNSSVGAECSTECDKGYTKQDSLVTVCRRGLWSNVTGSCIENDCTAGSAPVAPENANTFVCSTTGVGSTCSTRCADGYALESGSLTSRCSKGAWSASDGVCGPANCTGPGPAAPAYAASYNCPETPSGNDCSTSCLPGYGLTLDTSLQVTCSLGTWSKPDGVCFELGCAGKSPILPANAQEFNCASKTAGAECSTDCADGYTKQDSLVAVCRQGAWSTVNGTCVESACKTLPAAPIGALGFSSTCKGTPSRGSCSTSCDPRFVLARGNLTVTCSLGSWSTLSGVCAVLPTQPGCGKNCNCPTKVACTSGGPKSGCAWSDAAGKCFVMPP